MKQIIKWNKNNKLNKPEPNRAVLIKCKSGAGDRDVHDVMIYLGVDNSGEHQWRYGNFDLCDKAITHWCYLEGEPYTIKHKLKYFWNYTILKKSNLYGIIKRRSYE